MKKFERVLAESKNMLNSTQEKARAAQPNFDEMFF